MKFFFVGLACLAATSNAIQLNSVNPAIRRSAPVDTNGLIEKLSDSISAKISAEVAKQLAAAHIGNGAAANQDSAVVQKVKSRNARKIRRRQDPSSQEAILGELAEETILQDEGELLAENAGSMEGPVMMAETDLVNEEAGAYPIGMGINVQNGDEIIASTPDMGTHFRQKLAGATNIELWPGGVVFYRFDPTLTGLVKDQVKNAISYLNYHLSPCVELKEDTNQDQPQFAILREIAAGCMANIGYAASGERSLNVANSCTFGTIVHEFLHLLGAAHQQERADRDAFLTILTDNIQSDKIGQFQTQPANDNPIEAEGDFDYTSVMMYPKDAFAAKGKSITIETSNADMQDVIGQRIEASTADITKFRKAYKCAVVEGPDSMGWTPPVEVPRGFVSFKGPDNGQVVGANGLCADKCKPQTVVVSVMGQNPEDPAREVALDVCNSDGSPGRIVKKKFEPNFSFSAGIYCQGPIADVYFTCGTDVDCPKDMGTAGKCHEGRCDVPYVRSEE